MTSANFSGKFGRSCHIMGSPSPAAEQCSPSWPALAARDSTGTTRRGVDRWGEGRRTRCGTDSIPASAQRDPRTSQRFCLAIGCSHLQPIQLHSSHLLAGQDRCSCWILLTNFDRPPSLRSWGSRVRIAPGSPFDFAQLADLLLRALRIKTPNQTEPFPSTVSSAWFRSPRLAVYHF